MTREDADPGLLATWWCVNARRLRVDAAEFGWAPLLDAATADFDEGVPLQVIMAKHRLPMPTLPDTNRGSLVDLSGLGIEPLATHGHFVCPRPHPCGRRAAADPATGEEPACEYDRRPMRFDGDGPPR
jgi:hypothetical protein